MDYSDKGYARYKRRYSLKIDTRNHLRCIEYFFNVDEIYLKLNEKSEEYHFVINHRVGGPDWNDNFEDEIFHHYSWQYVPKKDGKKEYIKNFKMYDHNRTDYVRPVDLPVGDMTKIRSLIISLTYEKIVLYRLRKFKGE